MLVRTDEYSDYCWIILGVDAMKKRLETEKTLSKNFEEKERTEREFFKKREQVRSNKILLEFHRQ